MSIPRALGLWDMDIITIDTSKIKALATDGENFVFKPQAEKALLELKAQRDWINQLYDEVLERIAEAGKSENPNFKGVIGDKVRCIYRSYGAKYKARRNKYDDLEPFIERKEWVTVKADEVDKYFKEVGELPDGIYEADRSPKLSLSVKDEEPEETI